MSNPWFFLSYASADAGTEDLKAFYSELIVEVRQKAGLPGDTPDSAVGFMDTSGLSLGSAWPEEIGNALRTCRTFICLYSRNFFNSDYCGKEFQAFSARVDQYMAASGPAVKRPALILPVLWGDPGRLPKPLPHVVSHIEYKDARVGRSYATQGLYHLMRVRSEENLVEYRKFLQSLSDRVVREAELDRLPPLSALRPLGEEKNAFRLPAPGDSHAPETSQRRGGPSVARFVYVAGRDTELGTVRKRVECYGDEDYEWRPYHPDFGKAVGLISQGVAYKEGLHYEKLRLDEALIERLREAEKRNVIVVIVVDPWSIQVEFYQRRMSEFDRKEFLNCGVLIPWNERDEETRGNLDRLKTGVRTTFERKYYLSPTYFRRHIHSPEELQNEMYDTLNEVRARLIKRGEVASPPPGGGHMPSLSNVSRQPPPSPDETDPS